MILPKGLDGHRVDTHKTLVSTIQCHKEYREGLLISHQKPFYISLIYIV